MLHCMFTAFTSAYVQNPGASQYHVVVKHRCRRYKAGGNDGINVLHLQHHSDIRGYRRSSPNRSPLHAPRNDKSLPTDRPPANTVCRQQIAVPRRSMSTGPSPNH